MTHGAVQEMPADIGLPDIEPSGWFILRAPILPFGEFVRWGDATKRAPECALDVAAERSSLVCALRKIATRPEFREALFLASPEFESAVERWLATDEAEPDDPVVLPLVRYFSRMSTRATPYGFFAAVSLGEIGKSTAFSSRSLRECAKHLSLDWYYLSQVSSLLGRSPGVRERLLYRPNSTIHCREESYSYLEMRRLAGMASSDVRSYHLVTVEKSRHLARALASAENGAPLSQIARALVDEDPDIDEGAAREFLCALVDNQILEPSLMPTLTGPPPLEQMLESLEPLAEAAHVAQCLFGAREELRRLERERLGSPASRYRRIAEDLARLSEPGGPRGSIFKAELLRPGVAQLGPAVVKELRVAADLFLATAIGTAVPVLEEFRARFAERYGTREVPLLDVLDEEFGIGFELPGVSVSDPSPLLREVRFPAADPEALAAAGPRMRILSDLVHEVIRRGEQELRLEAADVEAMRGVEPPLNLPRAFSVMASLIAPSAAAVDQGNFKLLFHGISGPGGMNMVGRFAQFDEHIAAAVRAHLRIEQQLQPEVVLAEIVHVPDGREANIVQRPVLREYEIPFMGRSGAPGGRTIPPADLRISLRGKKIILRSERLGREVVPRLETAHRYSNSASAVYRFLAALARQDGASGVWAWAHPLMDLPFLPRVSCGRVILCRARWRLRQRDLDPLRKAGRGGLMQAVQRLRKERSLPRWICLEVGFNPITVDLENPLCLESVRNHLSSGGEITCTEFLPEPEMLVVESPEGGLVHEMIVPFVQRRARVRPALLRRPPSTDQRRFPPGSSWLTAKIYANTGLLDSILTTAISPLVEQLRSEGDITGWFFLRYFDPQPHLRLRLRGAPGRLTREALPALAARLDTLLRSERIWKLVLDTYDRETERYGGERGVLLAEQVFEHDSAAALRCLEQLQTAADSEDARWRVALLGAHRLMCDLRLAPADRLELARRLRDDLAVELRVDTACRKSLGEKYRRERAALEALLEPSAGEGAAALAGAIFLRRSEHLRQVADQMVDHERAGELTAPLIDIVGSLVHMSLNRLLSSDHRRHEAVVYDFLWRLNDSARARAARNGLAGKAWE